MGEIILGYVYKVPAATCSVCGNRPHVQRVLDGESHTEMFRVACVCGNHTAKKFTQGKAIRFWNNAEAQRK